MNRCDCGNKCAPCTNCFFPECECKCELIDVEFDEDMEYDNH